MTSVRHVFTHEIELQAEDLSPSGHVNNVSYLRFVDQARLAFLGQVPVGGSRYIDGLLQVLGDRALMLIGQHLLEFREEIWFREQKVRVELWLPHLGGSSLVIAGAVHDGDLETPAMVIESAGVLVDRQHRRPWPMDDVTRSALAEWSGERISFRPRAGLTPSRS